jgi:uncharacterized protein
MVKIVLTLVIVVLGLMFWFGKGRRSGAASQSSEPPRALTMVACAHCGLNLPQSEAVEGEGGRHYCGVEHRRLGPGAGAGG